MKILITLIIMILSLFGEAQSLTFQYGINPYYRDYDIYALTYNHSLGKKLGVELQFAKSSENVGGLVAISSDLLETDYLRYQEESDKGSPFRKVPDVGLGSISPKYGYGIYNTIDESMIVRLSCSYISPIYRSLAVKVTLGVGVNNYTFNQDPSLIVRPAVPVVLEEGMTDISFITTQTDQVIESLIGNTIELRYGIPDTHISPILGLDSVLYINGGLIWNYYLGINYDL